MVFPRMRRPGHFTIAPISATNGPRVTTRVLLTQSRRGGPVTTPVRTQGRALGVGHTDNLYAFTGRVRQASGYEQGAGTRNSARPRERLRAERERPPATNKVQ